jgi:hypothetical protein
MMQVLEGIEAWDDEAFDDEAFDDETLDDESVDDESEFLSQLIGGPASLIGNAIGSLFGGNRGPSRPPLPRVAVGTPGSGVSTATLTTPAGTATLRLPEPVVTRREFDAGLRKLQEGINRDSARVNAVAKDLDGLRTRVATVVTETQRDIGKVRTAVLKSRRANRLALARLRQDQSSQQMMSMVMAMMAQRQVQERLEDHKHAGDGTVVDTEDTKNSMLMMLPMVMMMGQGGGSNAMMMPMMMLAMQP